MVLSISIPPDTEAALKLRATAAGEELPAFVSRLVSQFTGAPTPLEQLSGPVYQKFLESGMTDDELGNVLEKAKFERRAERRARQQP
jgi:hypothetical protein